VADKKNQICFSSHLKSILTAPGLLTLKLNFGALLPPFLASAAATFLAAEEGLAKRKPRYCLGAG